MQREKNLIKNTVVLGFGKIFPQLAALITLPIYTGMLSTAEYGTYDLINVLVYILDVVVVLQIHQAVFRFLIDVRGTKKEELYISNTAIFSVFPALIASIILGLCCISQPPLIRVLIGIYLFFNIEYSVCGQIARGLGDNKRYTIASIISSGLNMILVIALISGLKWGFIGLFTSLDLAYAVATLYMFFGCGQHKKIQIQLFDWKIIKEMLVYSWPMIPNTLSVWVVQTADKFIIRLFLGVEKNGIFAVAQKIPNIFSLAYSTFNMAWQESASISEKDADSSKYYNEIFGALFDFLVGCMLVLISFTPILFAILVRGSYEESYNQIPLIYIGVFFSSISSFFGSIYIAKKATVEVGVSSIIAAVVNCVINFTLIKWIGLYAASISTIVAYLILALYRGFDINRRGYAKINYRKGHATACVILISISCVLCYQQKLVCNIVNAVIGIIGFIVLNRKMLVAVCSGIFKKFREGK